MQWRIEFFKARFAGALDSKYRRKEIDQFDDYAYHRFVQSPLSPILPLPMRLLPRKKRGKIACVRLLLYRLLSSRKSSSPTTIIATMVPIDIGTKYKSAADAGDAVGGAVAAGCSSTVKLVSEYDGQ